jgi:hypothetical protein
MSGKKKKKRKKLGKIKLHGSVECDSGYLVVCLGSLERGDGDASNGVIFSDHRRVLMECGGV